MKILALDIETAPNTAHVWGLFKENIPLDRLRETSRVLCVSYKWINEKGPVRFVSETGGRGIMLDEIHKVMDEADVILTYNGKKFDVPTLHREFLVGGWKPPAPAKQVDLYRVARKHFRFASFKMDHLAKELHIRTKVRHGGYELWLGCMAGDSKAWKKMRRYNIRDVLILEQLYKRMLPWISTHPSYHTFASGSRPVCTNCGSTRVQQRGHVVTKTRKYNRFCCSKCGTWMRGVLSIPTLPREALLTQISSADA